MKFTFLARAFKYFNLNLNELKLFDDELRDFLIGEESTQEN
jgi:hypothetical protein